MQNGKVGKIRNLVQDIHNEKVCIQSFIDLALKLSKQACILEVENSPNALSELKRGARELRDLGTLFYRRLCDEVTPEVIAYRESLPKGSPRGKDIRENLKNKEQNNNN